LNTPITIIPVEDKHRRRQFIRLPLEIYKDDPYYIQRLHLEQSSHLGNHNPFFKHARARFFLALDGKNRPVGRISAQIDTLAQDKGARPGEFCGHFGFPEAVDSTVLHALIEAAEAWLRGEGVAHLSGPFSLSINDEAGLLIKGHESPPYMMMNHSMPWYGPALEKYGFSKSKDLLAFHFDIGTELAPPAARMAERALSMEDLCERPLRRRHLDEELHTILSIFNDSWSDNWGFIPLTDAEVNHFVSTVKWILVPDLVRIVEIHGEAVAMLVALPDMNEAIAGLNGRLFPLGWAKIFWRLKVRGLTRARVLLMGIRKSLGTDLRSAAISALLVSRVNDAFKRYPRYKESEMSWVLEDNHRMVELIRLIGGTAYKTYRIYEKAI